MSEKQGHPSKPDYSIEIGSFIVLVILSGLSHFWYIVIAICIGMLFWATVALIVRLARSAANGLSSAPRATQANSSKHSGFQNQVFQPRKIRQSVDC
jgi:hypothetical protein